MYLFENHELLNKYQSEMIDFFVIERLESMIKIIKEDNDIEEFLVSRLSVIFNFCNTTFSIEMVVLSILHKII